MASLILPRLIRGRLYFVLGPVAFPTLAGALRARRAVGGAS